MVWEIIVAAFLVALGFLGIYFSAEEGIGDGKMLVILIIGLSALIGGGWIIVTRIALVVLLAKVAGIIFAFLGFFLVWGFPDAGEYQSDNMSKGGVFLGVFFFVLGLYLLLFA